uniref:Uncharacterized protein n=1 Tax=Melopsittacus undulatus TaxID=13146 RepID=A0A8C6J5W7_MELUD
MYTKRTLQSFYIQFVNYNIEVFVCTYIYKHTSFLKKEHIYSAQTSKNSKSDLLNLTSPAAYMGTITGCFLLTIFLVSIPKEHKSFLLLWEPPHWYLSPYASWISCSSVHTSISSLYKTGMEGKQTSNIRSRRLSNVVCSKEKIFTSS